MYCSPCPQVTQPGAGVVLALAGPESAELVAEELEMQLRNLMGTMSRLVRERDLGAQVGDRQGLSVVITQNDFVGLGGPMYRGFGRCFLTFDFLLAVG